MNHLDQPNSKSLSPNLAETPILIVDDLQDNLDLLEDMLANAGFRSITSAHSAAEALDILKKRHDIGLVLLDLIMPEMDGCAACRHITSDPRTAHIPVIMVTGAALHRDKALIQSFEAGAIDFVDKPLHELELFGRVRSALALYHERKALDEKTRALAASEERFRLAVAGVNDGIWDLNLSTGKAYLSPTWKRMLGYAEEELDNTVDTWRSFIHPDDKGRFDAAMREHLDAPDSLFIVEHRMLSRNGELLWVLTRGATQRNPEGQPLRMCGSTTDITKRKSLELQLWHSQKMECIGRFAGGIVHDFNNIVALISGYAEVILTAAEQPDKIIHYTRRMLHAADHAATLSRQLLTLSRKAPVDLRPLHLPELLNPLGDILQHLVSKRAKLIHRYDDGVPPILADPSMIEQVILNLVLNARDAIPSSGGTVTLEVTYTQPSSCLPQREARDSHATDPFADGSVVIRVSDTGCGMDEATLARAFEPFFTTKPEGARSGLGLAIAFSIVRQHNGFINIKSEVDKGTVVELYFPSLNANVQTNTPSSIKVFEAGSGPDAIAVWERHRDEIDVLFTDIVMPEGMTGIDIARRFRAEKPKLKVIYTSGYNLQTIPGGRAIGKDDPFIPKPYLPSKVIELIRTALAARTT